MKKKATPLYSVQYRATFVLLQKARPASPTILGVRPSRPSVAPHRPDRRRHDRCGSGTAASAVPQRQPWKAELGGCTSSFAYLLSDAQHKPLLWLLFLPLCTSRSSDAIVLGVCTPQTCLLRNTPELRHCMTTLPPDVGSTWSIFCCLRPTALPR